MTADVGAQINHRRGRFWLPHLLALVILALCFVFGALTFESLPDTVATHWGPSGRPDAWAPKSFEAVFSPLMMGAGLCVLLSLVTALVPKMVQVDDDASLWERYRREGTIRGTVAVLGGTSVLIAAIIGFLSVAGWTTPDHVAWWPAAVVTALFLVVIPVSYAAAARWARRTASAQGIHPTAADEQEEKLWIAGVLYNDPNDPHLLVAKRAGTGVGLTVNVGNTRGRVAVAVFLGLFVVLPVILGVVAAL